MLASLWQKYWTSTSREKNLSWLMVLGGSECACLTSWPRPEHHGSRNIREVVTSQQKGSKEGGWGRGVTLQSLLLESHFLHLHPTHQNGTTIRNWAFSTRAWGGHFISKPWLLIFLVLVFGDNQKLRCQDFKQHNDWFWGTTGTPAGPASLVPLLCLRAFLEWCWHCRHSLGWSKGRIGRSRIRRQK